MDSNSVESVFSIYYIVLCFVIYYKKEIMSLS